GALTCRSFGLPVFAPGEGALDTSCRAVGPVTFDATGTWSVRARWLSGCDFEIGRRTVTLNVACLGSAPADAGPDQAVSAGGSLRTGGAPAVPGLTSQWSPPVLVAEPASAEPLASPPARTTFRLTVIDGSGCSSSDDVVVQVNPLPAADAG